eukprot:evm.model.NODE_37437_length_30217_cov_24.682034.7
MLDRLDGYFVKLVLESCEKLLGKPSSPEHPPTSDAVADFYPVVPWWYGEFDTRL